MTFDPTQAAKAALMYAQAAEDELRAAGAPMSGIAKAVTYGRSPLVLWAVFFHVAKERAHEAVPVAPGLPLWQLKGEIGRVTWTANALKTGQVTFSNLPTVPISALTEEDYKQARAHLGIPEPEEAAE